jgi:hypothetical protein
MGRVTGSPSLLIDSDFPGGTPPGEAEIRRFFVSDVCRTAGIEPPSAALDEDPAAALIRAGVLADEDREEIERRYAVCRSNARALAANRPQVHPGTVHYLRAGDSRDDSTQWRHVAPGLRTHEIAGADHYTLLGPRHVGAVAELIRTVCRERETTWNS